MRGALRFRLRDFPRPLIQVRVWAFRHVDARAILFCASDDGRIAFLRHRPSLRTNARAKSAAATLSVARSTCSRSRGDRGRVKGLSDKHGTISFIFSRLCFDFEVFFAWQLREKYNPPQPLRYGHVEYHLINKMNIRERRTISSKRGEPGRYHGDNTKLHYF